MKAATTRKLPQDRHALELANRQMPFPVVDVVEIGIVGRARKYVSSGEAFAPAHFPGQPILPGVMIIAALVGLASAMPDPRRRGSRSLRRIRRFRFRQPVFPGDLLELEVRPVEREGDADWFEAKAFVDGELAAAGRLLLS